MVCGIPRNRRTISGIRPNVTWPSAYWHADVAHVAHVNRVRIRKLRIICVFRIILHPSVEVLIVLDGDMEVPVLPRRLHRIDVRRRLGAPCRVSIYLILDIVVRRLDREKRLGELRPDLRRPVIYALEKR
jgi:hypothetical protein